MSAIMAFAFYPLYCSILRRIGSRGVAALLTLVCILAFLIIPIVFMVSALIEESRSAYIQVLSAAENSDEVISQVNTLLSDMVGMQVDVTRMVAYGIQLIIQWMQKIVFSIPVVAVNIFIMLFTLYYLLKDSEKFKLFIVKMLPLDNTEKEHFITRVSDVMYGVIFGHIGTAIIQGVAALIGYAITGVPAPILWGMITILCAFIPVIGTAIVWIPASAYLFFMGIGDGTWGWGVGLLIYGIIVIGQIDNISRPFLISGKTHIHPAIVLVGALGGLSVFGISGLFIGPLILAILKEFIVAYEDRKGRI